MILAINICVFGRLRIKKDEGLSGQKRQTMYSSLSQHFGVTMRVQPSSVAESKP